MENLGRNDKCWCGSGKKYKSCHLGFDDKLRTFEDLGYEIPTHNMIKNQQQIESIKKSAAINISILDYIEENIREGITTEEIDQWVYRITEEAGAIPATLGYDGFPKSCCTSINDEVCHGIPDEKITLKSGDIINVDISTILDGYFSDSSRMFCIGEVSEKRKRLVQVTKECVEEGLKAVKPWKTLGDIGAAVENHANKNGYTVVREIGGHGVGIEFHEEPWVSFVSKVDTGVIMAPGMMFTIEPMVNEGTQEIFEDEKNGWTWYTKDHKDSAQWEVMLLVTEDGYEIISY